MKLSRLTMRRESACRESIAPVAVLEFANYFGREQRHPALSKWSRLFVVDLHINEDFVIGQVGAFTEIADDFVANHFGFGSHGRAFHSPTH